jgi:DNA (cytosine-5)-methyltransferase 1
MKPLRFVSLFSGAGGMDLGFEQAGWQCSYASDVEGDCIATLERNRGRRVDKLRVLSDCYIEQADIRTLRGREIRGKAGVSRAESLTIVGGPPCQSWSSAGRQRGFDDTRGQLIRDYVRIASELDARWLVFENVRGLLTARGADGEPGSALREVREALLAAGFQTEVNLLNAADYGVPQRRVRLFMIGFRLGDRPPFPQPTHTRDPDLFRSGLMGWITVRQALERVPLLEDDLIRPNPKLAHLLAQVGDGSGLKSPGKAETTRPGGHWGYKQGCFIADPAMPARTVTASTQQDWLRDPKFGLRRLSPKDCAALQTFPPAWEFLGKRSSAYRQIGNAVPPVLAKAIASELRQHVAVNQRFARRPMTKTGLLPLSASLVSAIEYTKRDETRNGESRRRAALAKLKKAG